MEQKNLETYEVEEVKRDFSVRGISDEVSKYSIIGMKYPNIKIVAKEKNPKSYKLQILSSMKIGENSDLYNNSEKTVTVYFKGVGLETIECGKIYQSQVRALLKLFDGDCEIVANMNQDRELTGKYVYAMCM